MRPTRTLVASAAAAALLAAPLATTQAASHAKAPAPRFLISALGYVGHTSTYDVTLAPAFIKVRVQVKDFDKKFDPTTVKLIVIEKATGTPATTFVVATRRVGKSKVVSNWLGTITVPQGAAPAMYCLSVVKVDDANPATLPVLKTAKGLAGRDCFTVTDTNPTPPPSPTPPAV